MNEKDKKSKKALLCQALYKESVYFSQEKGSVMKIDVSNGTNTFFYIRILTVSK